MSKSGGRAELLRLAGPELRQAIIERLRAAAAEILKRAPGQVDVDWVSPNPGDLWAFFQRATIREFGFPLYFYDIPYCRSIRDLAEHIANELPVPPAPLAPMGDLYSGGRWDWGPVERGFDAPLKRPAVFVLSAPRVGSTLLVAMLGQHPRLCALSELFLLPFESMGTRARLIGDSRAWLRVGLLSAICGLTAMTSEQAANECVMLEERDIRISAVYTRLQELMKGRILVDKSPGYAMHPAWLACAEKVFRTPKYIHLTRHPAAVVESFVRRRFHRLGPQGLVWDENPWIFAEKIWTSSNLHVTQFLRGIDPARQIRISYEALVGDPAGELRRVCDFLEVPFDAAMLDPYRGHDEREVALGDPGFHGHSGIEAELASGWRAAWQPHQFGEITRTLAAELGYEVA